MCYRMTMDRIGMASRRASIHRPEAVAVPEGERSTPEVLDDLRADRI